MAPAGPTEVDSSCSRKYLGQIMRPVKGWRAYLEHCDEQLALGEPAEEGGAPTHKHPPAPTGRSRVRPRSASSMLRLRVRDYGFRTRALEEWVASAGGERPLGDQERGAEQGGRPSRQAGRGGSTLPGPRDPASSQHLHSLSEQPGRALCLRPRRQTRNSSPAPRGPQGPARSKTPARDRCLIKVFVFASSL